MRPDAPPSPAHDDAPRRAAPSLARFLALQTGLGPSTGSASASNATESRTLEAQRRRQGIYNFFAVPSNLEPFLLFGYVTCVDAFIDLVTFLPLRVLVALHHAMSGGKMTPTMRKDVVHGLLIVLVSAVLDVAPAIGVAMSQAYHNVRNQSVMKLYVVFNVLEIFDKLCSSSGLDILEALHVSLIQPERRERGQLSKDLVLAFCYVLVHTLVLFYQVVALSVAINSHNNVLLTLLISNNFTELKINVFKRVEPENLFQISCADAVERFQLVIYLLIVAIQFLFVQKEELTTVRINSLVMALLQIILCEIVIDWIKHAFVLKFNRVSPKIYSKFSRILGVDSIKSARTDQLAALTARFGFTPMPLFCLLMLVINNDVLPCLDLSHPSGWILLLLLWLVFCLAKLLTSIAVLGSSTRLQGAVDAEAAATAAKTVAAGGEKRPPSSAAGSAGAEAAAVPGASAGTSRPHTGAPIIKQIGSETELRLEGVSRYSLVGKAVPG